MNKIYEVHVEVPVKVRVSYYTPARPGQLSGPPEACYPAKDVDIDYQIVNWDEIISGISETVNDDEDTIIALHEASLDEEQ